MNRLYLIRKTSVIHAIKCKKTEDFAVAQLSSDTLSDFKRDISVCNGTDTAHAEINARLDIWAGTNPIATAREIDAMM